MTITITLNKQRHVVAVTAEFQRSAKPGTVEDFARAELERWADQLADQIGVDSIPVWRFVRRFTNAEFDAITAAGESDANVAQILDKLNTVAGGVVRLGSETMVQAMGYLVAVGLLTQARANRITAYGPGGVVGEQEQ